MKSRLFAILALCLSIGTACAEGQNNVYKALDANGDGYIGPAEGAELEVIIKKWELLDINRDGRLDREEFARLEVLESESRENIRK